jgi:hypothetical protein
LLEVLREEAERQGISVNALHKRILKNYSLNWRWVERLKPVVITRPTIAGIIGCCPEDSIEQIAKISGSIGAKDALRTLGINPTYDKLTNFIKENLGTYGNWFDYSHHVRGKKDIIHLRHELGRKWSVFIANQVATMFKSILNITPKTEIFDNCATLEITT